MNEQIAKLMTKTDIKKVQACLKQIEKQWIGLYYLIREHKNNQDEQIENLIGTSDTGEKDNLHNALFDIKYSTQILQDIFQKEITLT